MPKAAIAALADELSRARDMLLINTTALATHGLIDSDRLKDCKKFPGYKPIASDVATIVEIIKERWPVLENKTPLTLPQLNELASRASTSSPPSGSRSRARRRPARRP